MLKRPVFPLLLLLVLPLFWSFDPHSDNRPAQIFRQMYDSIKVIKTIRQNVVAIERVENRFSVNKSFVKVQTHPRKVYYVNPAKKLEVLYDAEVHEQKAWVKPHVFPYLTVVLDPLGNIMRKNQHYSIHALGYDFIGKSIALTINKDREGLARFSYKGKVNKNGYNCHLIEYENKSYGYVDYVVKEKETATSISLNLCVNDYLLREKNDLLNDFSYLKKGMVLKVPNLYCQKAVLFIDEKLMLPVSLSLYDDKGLFESYEYTNIVINQPFAPDEFRKENPEYHF